VNQKRWEVRLGCVCGWVPEVPMNPPTMINHLVEKGFAEVLVDV